jgi:hypothetical protein
MDHHPQYCPLMTFSTCRKWCESLLSEIIWLAMEMVEKIPAIMSQAENPMIFYRSS